MNLNTGKHSLSKLEKYGSPTFVERMSSVGSAELCRVRFVLGVRTALSCQWDPFRAGAAGGGAADPTRPQEDQGRDSDAEGRGGSSRPAHVSAGSSAVQVGTVGTHKREQPSASE